MYRPILVAGTMLAICACSDPVSTSRYDGPVTITPSIQWSGGVATVTTDQLLNYPTTPVITAGTDTLASAVVDDTTLSVTLPPLPSGTVNLIAHGSAGDLDLGSVSLVGYSGRIQASGFLGEQQRWSRSSPAGALGETANGKVGYLHAANGVLTILPVDDGASPYGPGASYRDNVFTVLSPNGVDFWQYSAGGTPVKLDSAPVSNPAGRPVHELAPWTFLVPSHHSMYIEKSPDNGATFTTTYNPSAAQTEESTWGVVYAPSGSLATIRVSATPMGVPVFDLPAGTLRYRVPLYEPAGGAVFTTDGELYMAGDTLYGGPGDIVLRLDANTGAELGRTSIPAPWSVLGFATDVTESHLYAFLSGFPSGLAVMVLDRSLQPVATLAVPEGTGFSTLCDGITVIPDAAHGKVYAMSCLGEVLTFDLLN